MKAKLFGIACILFLGINDALAQNYDNWAVGFRVGEPLGLNIRKYFDSGNKNFDVNIGTYGLLWGNSRHYRKDDYYTNQAGGMIQGIFHWNKQLGASENFQVYYGFGGQINSRKTALPIGNTVAERKLSLGGVGNAGLEFPLPNQDLSIFTDFGLYAEIAPKFLFSAINAGVGVRLNITR